MIFRNIRFSLGDPRRLGGVPGVAYPLPLPFGGRSVGPGGQH